MDGSRGLLGGDVGGGVWGEGGGYGLRGVDGWSVVVGVFVFIKSTIPRWGGTDTVLVL